jgi:hypothetical protein
MAEQRIAECQINCVRVGQDKVIRITGRMGNGANWVSSHKGRNRDRKHIRHALGGGVDQCDLAVFERCHNVGDRTPNMTCTPNPQGRL